MFVSLSFSGVFSGIRRYALYSSLSSRASGGVFQPKPQNPNVVHEVLVRAKTMAVLSLLFFNMFFKDLGPEGLGLPNISQVFV